MKKIKILLTVLVFAICLGNNTNGVSAMGISSQCGILMEQSTGRVLYEKCADDQMYIASITKILTTIVAIENADLDAWVEVSDNVTRQVGSSLYLALGDQVKLIDLLYGLMLRSGNDAAMAIAEFVGGDEEGFVKMMNEKAKEIGMVNSIFQNPSGLDETTYNLSTARDMALVMQYAMNNPIFREITGTKTHKATSKNGTNYVWHNKHKLVTGYYEYAIGGKTGFTVQARRTLVTSARKDDMELVVVTLKAGDDWNDHMSLFNYGFDNYEVQTVIEPGEIQVVDQALNDKLYVEKQVNVVVNKDGSETVTTNLSLYEEAKGNEVGVLQVLMNGEIQQEIPVYKAITPEVKEQSWFDKLKNWFTGAVSF
ncbi:MAG: D-alanyl-D-alanine carboxypeptidase [Turicibacter sp.]|nr:D-alanyl-D-alanine carboxypeptidase [Turicibacter sp.]